MPGLPSFLSHPPLRFGEALAHYGACRGVWGPLCDVLHPGRMRKAQVNFLPFATPLYLLQQLPGVPSTAWAPALALAEVEPSLRIVSDCGTNSPRKASGGKENGEF